MRQGQNRFPIIILCALLASGCGGLFKRSKSAPEDTVDPTTELQRENQNKQVRINELESSVGTLHGRINELETKLRAAESKPQALAEAPKKYSMPTNDQSGELPQDFVARSYQQAKILMNLEKYPEAVLAFSALTEKYFKHPLASHAQYGLATAYYKQGEFSIAAQEYENVIKKYPYSARVADSYVKLADCYEKTGKPQEAEKALLQVKANFPDFYTGQSKTAPSAKVRQQPIETPTAPAVEIPTAPQVAVETVEGEKESAPSVSAFDAPPSEVSDEGNP